MTTIINTPPAGENADSGAGMVLGVVVAILLVAVFILFILPALRTSSYSNATPQGGSINVNVTNPIGATPSPTYTP